MAEDLGLIHFVQDTFEHDFEPDYRTNPYSFVMNPSTKARNFQSSAGVLDDSFAPGRSSSPSHTAQVGIEDYFPSGFFSTDAEGQVTSLLQSSLQPVACSDSNIILPEQPEESLLRGFEPSQETVPLRKVDFQHSSTPRPELHILDQQLQERSTLLGSRSPGTPTSLSRKSHSEGNSAGYWRGMTRDVLMKQLQGHLPSTVSAHSERGSVGSSAQDLQLSNIRSLCRSMSPPLKPTPVNLPRMSYQNSSGVDNTNRGESYRRCTTGGIKAVTMLSKSGSNANTDIEHLKSLGTKANNFPTLENMALERTQGQKSSKFESELNMAEAEMATSNSQLVGARQGGNRLPSLEYFDKTPSTSARVQSGNNSWSSSIGCTSDPDPPSIEQDTEAGLIWVDFLKEDSRVATHGQLGFNRSRKRAKSSDEVITTNFANAELVGQNQRYILQEKILTLVQADFSSKEDKGQVLDDTIEFLKNLRRKLSNNEANRILHEGYSLPDLTAVKKGAPPASLPDNRKLGIDGLPILHLEDLQLETEGVNINPNLTVDDVPQIEVRMMEHELVMVKLVTKDRPGLFSHIMLVLRTLRLDVQHANVRTSKNGRRQDIFAVKMQIPISDSQSTHSIATALNRALSTTTASRPHSRSA